LLYAIIKTGLFAGSLDIICAMGHYYIKNGKNPIQVLNFIASGVFDKDAFSGGIEMAVWGLLFHFTIACIWTVFYFLAYPRFSLLSKNSKISGILYGAFVWVIMTMVVVPLSNTPNIPFDITQAVIGVLILMGAIGLPISLMAEKYYMSKA
jgi:uncharacterized membrane protein YagU involved in acid resistance